MCDVETFQIQCIAGWNERAMELNARYKEAVSHWNIAGLPRSAEHCWGALPYNLQSAGEVQSADHFPTTCRGMK